MCIHACVNVFWREGFRQRAVAFLPNLILRRKPIIFKLSLITVPGTIDEVNEAESRGPFARCQVWRAQSLFSSLGVVFFSGIFSTTFSLSVTTHHSPIKPQSGFLLNSKSSVEVKPFRRIGSDDRFQQVPERFFFGRTLQWTGLK